MDESVRSEIATRPAGFIIFGMKVKDNSLNRMISISEYEAFHETVLKW